MKFLPTLFIFPLALPVLSSPTPARLEKRATTPIYTLTSGATPPTALPTPPCNGLTTGSTRNDLLTLPCKNLTLIFARGTFETGNLGGIVGPPFAAALVALLGDAQVAVQGVNNYPADVAGFMAGGSATGAQNVASLIDTARTKCPKTKLVVSGYSQGAQVAHKAAGEIGAADTAFINSVVLYGDPDLGEGFGGVSPARVSTDCHVGDDMCLHGDLILPPHLDYCLDVGGEAEFVVGKSVLKGV